MRIFLIGFMGSGKTTIGRRLAERIGFDFVDTDRFIEMQQGLTISEIFARHGDAAFREMERNLLLELQNLDYAVLSTGGGLPCYGDNMDMMLASGKVLYLRTSPQALTHRLFYSRTERPLITGKTEKELQQYIVEKLSEREPFYLRAHITVQTEKFSMEELLQALNLMKTM
jgi:shikimate kinase